MPILVQCCTGGQYCNLDLYPKSGAEIEFSSLAFVLI